MFRRLGNAISVTTVYGVTLIALIQGTLQLLPMPVAATPLAQPIMNNLSVDTTAVTSKMTASGIPKHLSIPALKMEKVIEPGVYDQDRKIWQVSARGIHFATLSSPVNDLAGNTLIYGHNNKQVFGPLKRLINGDKAEIRTDNGFVFTYVFAGKSDTEPEDTSIFSYSGAPLLTLQTCSGIFNEIRTFYTFKLESFRTL